MNEQKKQKQPTGYISAIYGSLIEVKGIEKDVQLHNMIEVVEHKIIGEVIQIYSDHIIAQCFENTNQLRLNNKVIDLREPISMELGPGLLSNIFDGIQRPLEKIYSNLDKSGFLERGTKIPSLSRTKKWRFVPTKSKNDKVNEGDIIGIVQETTLIQHKIMVPPGVSGTLSFIIEEGDYTVIDDIYTIKNSKQELTFGMLQKWPIYKNRPFKESKKSKEPLITGLRVIDLLFPLAKGGTVAVPGGFGTGKCVSPDTPILLSNGLRKNIKELFDSYKKKNGKIEFKTKEESLIKIESNLEVLSLNSTSFKKKSATHIYKGKTDKIITIKTRTGRSLKLTPIHKLHIFNGIEIVKKTANEIEIGDYIIVPRKITIPGEDFFFNAYDIDDSLLIVEDKPLKEVKKIIITLQEKYGIQELAKELNVSVSELNNYKNGLKEPPLKFVKDIINISKSQEIPINLLKAEHQSEPFYLPKKLTKEMAEWLGLFIADGHIKGKYDGIYFYNTSNQILTRFKELTQKVFGFNTKFGQDSEDRTPFMFLRNTAFKKFLYWLGIPKKNKTHEVKIPDCILKSSEKILIHFLNGYFAGDGWFSKYTVGFSTASKKLHSDLTYLLSRLGILYRVSEKKNSFYIELEGKLSENLGNLLKKSNVYVYEKLIPLFNYCDQNIKHFDGLEDIPLDISILKNLKTQGKDHLGHDIFKKHLGIRIDNYINQKQKPSLTTLRKIYDLIEEFGQNNDINLRKHLHHIISLNENLFFDQVREKEEQTKKTNVYDLTIEDYHNFIGGEQPIVLHNTVIQQSLAKWSDADIIIYCGVGERGNEIADVLHQFRKIIDPKSGRPLLERIVIIANTSNMPVSAREASMFSGVTIGEYYRDMGYNVAVLADSTSRWAEALREISGLLEEMPAEEGYPAYLPSKLSSFYERAGIVLTLGDSDDGTHNRIGSVSIIGSVSPPSGDFSEPVTATTKRFVQAFWALDASLAYSKHYPAINWLNSYSNYPDYIFEWWKERDVYWEELKDITWNNCRIQVNQLLSKESELKNITQLIGKENLPEDQQLIIFIAELIRNSFLIQSAFDNIDCFTQVEKLICHIKLILLLYKESIELLNKGFIIEDITKLNVINDILRISQSIANDQYEKIIDIKNKLLKEINQMKSMFGGSRERLL
ncbi:MAG: hypothetical protein JW891_02855 [Candidatus Lokiarchaeota archaeon]|nr:hypothetical protein [Candidatus Lokiarchaeota archaeon]